MATIRQRIRAAWTVFGLQETAKLRTVEKYATGRMREGQAQLGDPDDHLRYNQGGARYFRPITKDPTRDLSALDQARMAEVCVHLFQTNPLAKRLVRRRTNYALGKGIKITATSPKAQEVINKWREDDNFDERLRARVSSWHGVFGELPLSATVNPIDGTVRTGYIAPDQVEDVETIPGNIEVRTCLLLKSAEAGKGKRRYWIIREDTDPDSPTHGKVMAAPDTSEEAPDFERQRVAMMEKAGAPPNDGSVFFFTANALPNMKRGISDLWVIADYTDAYETIMWDTVDRAAIVNAFIAHMIHTGLTPEEVQVQAERFGETTPKSGTMIHTNEKVELKLLTPDLVAAGSERFSDLVLAVIATGAGVPDYWLNASVDPNRASAEAMAVPVLRDMEDMQQEIANAVRFMVRFVLDQAVLHGTLPEGEDLTFDVEMPPLGDRQAAQNAAALQQVTAAVATLVAEKLLDRDTAIRLIAIMIRLLGIEADASEIVERLDDEEAEQASNPPPTPIAGLPRPEDLIALATNGQAPPPLPAQATPGAAPGPAGTA